MVLADYEKVWTQSDKLVVSGHHRVIGIIDQPLWANPVYAPNIINYENATGHETSMHGPCVTSIAIGQIGVARDGLVVYRAYAAWTPNRQPELHAKALKSLKVYVETGGHLDCLSTSHSLPFSSDSQNNTSQRENLKLTDWFEQRNIPVFYVGNTPGYSIGPNGYSQQLQRQLNLLPNDTARTRFLFDYSNGVLAGVPVDERNLAVWEPQETSDGAELAFRSTTPGGESWRIPFIAGLFLLAREINASITRQQFLQALRETTRPVVLGDHRVHNVVDVERVQNHLIRRYLHHHCHLS